MAKRRAPKQAGTKLGDVLADQAGLGEREKPAKRGKDVLEGKVDELRGLALAESVPFPDSLEKQLKACKTKGAVKRAWREHRRKVDGY